MHRFPLRVYFEDTDAAGIVYYANYLKFAERARTEMFRGLGLNHAKLITANGITFVVRKCTVDYLAPARLDDSLTVESKITTTSPTKIQLQQHIMRESQYLTDIAVTLVCINGSGKPTRIPQEVTKILPEDL